MSAIFLILCIAAFLWALFLDRAVDDALSRSLPPEFTEGITSRFTSVFALSPLTPLPVQVDYVKFLAAASFGLLCLSLFVFSNGKVLGGWLMFGVFLLNTFSTLKAWKTYKENCNRPVTSDEQEES
jgi:hypothetical protein